MQIKRSPERLLIIYKKTHNSFFMYSVEGIYLFYAYIYLNAIKKEGISTLNL